jgi:hypothetical protein
VSGGWKMSSTNTWFSKIALAQHVVRRLFPEAMNAGPPALFPFFKNPTP